MARSSTARHQPVNHQPVLGWIDIHDRTGVVAHEKQTIRCDDAVLALQRRHGY